MTAPVIVCENLVKIYKVADLEVVALQGLDLEVQPGEMIALVGVSGSGKTTLLNILGGLDTSSAGRVSVAGHDLARQTEAQRLRYRRFTVGHIWQQSGRNLLPELTLQENIELPQLLSGIPRRERAERTRELLRLIGLEQAAGKRPVQLSGGEQQRGGIAVALANRPAVLLADEPTGELDSQTAAEILQLLRTLNHQLGLTIVLVTHDPALAAQVDRVIAMRDGRTSTETVRREVPLAAPPAQVLSASAVIALPGETHHESILIDRAGRLQLPREALELIPFQGRAEVLITSDHVELWPVRSSSRRIPQPPAQAESTRSEEL
jgi:ABC-type lipoprotein export system ATPase subunit